MTLWIKIFIYMYYVLVINELPNKREKHAIFMHIWNIIFAKQAQIHICIVYIYINWFLYRIFMFWILSHVKANAKAMSFQYEKFHFAKNQMLNSLAKFHFDLMTLEFQKNTTCRSIHLHLTNYIRYVKGCLLGY